MLKYVEKKIEKAKDNQGEGPESEREKAVISAAPTVGETGKDGEPKSKENIDIANSAVLTDEEREADKEAKEKIDNAIEERSKSNPLPPPPPPPPVDGSGIEFAFKSKDGDSNTDIARSGMFFLVASTSPFKCYFRFYLCHLSEKNVSFM